MLKSVTLKLSGTWDEDVAVESDAVESTKELALVTLEPSDTCDEGVVVGTDADV